MNGSIEKSPILLSDHTITQIYYKSVHGFYDNFSISLVRRVWGQNS